MADTARLLLVEDEPAIRGGLTDAFTALGHRVDAAATGDDGLVRGLAGGHDAALLDVMLPGVDGFTICRRLRERHPRLGILMLTARGSEQDVLEGFRAGADDYVPKPFSLALLAARVDAVLRRSRGPAGASFTVAGIAIDPAALRAVRGAAAAELTRRDVELLARLARDPGAVVQRAALLADVWGYAQPDAVETRCVDMHLVKLRRKLGEAFGAAGEALVETVRGEGYRIGSRP
jgi:DNA-binding response OmpR family regulator